MSIVVDTNVVAYYVLGTEPYRDECAAFFRSRADFLAPASWEAELVNVVWLSIQHQLFDVAEGLHRLRLASLLGIRSVSPSTLWEGALARAVAHQHPAYDTLFVELAVREGCPLATFDQRLRELFPATASLPGHLLSP